MDTAIQPVAHRAADSLRAVPSAQTLNVSAVYQLSETGRKAALLAGADGKAVQRLSVHVPATRLHLVSVDLHGSARLKLQPRFDRVNGQVVRRDGPPTNIHPLDEGESYQRLVASGRTIDDVAVAIGQSKGYVYQRISLTRLVPKVQDLLARDVLPLIYALKIAVVPAEQQEDALAQCFRPLFRDEEARRDQLEPLAQLTAWVEKTVRLNPRSEEVHVLLPTLAEQVVSAEQERDASVLALSTLHFHTDRTDPKPILAKSWKPADGKDRCPHARPGVIVLGEGQGTFLQVCIAKKECEKHWARATPRAAAQQEGERDDAEARRKQEEAWAKRRAETERWRTELRPRAVRLIADRTAKLPWSRMLLRLLLEEIRIDDLFLDAVGKPEALPVSRYPQAVATALALRHSWQRGDLMAFSKRLGVKVTSKDLADHPDSITPDPKTRKATSDRPRKTPSNS